MKLSSQLAKLKQRKQTQQAAPRPGRRQGGKPLLSRWALLALGLILAGGGTWAGLELFLWNKLPPALVGKWEVREGPMAGGTFEFFRKGTLEIHANSQGADYAIKAQVAVKDKTLLTTTHNASTRLVETSQSIIRELTEHSLILELEKGDVLKMVRRN